MPKEEAVDWSVLPEGLAPNPANKLMSWTDAVKLAETTTNDKTEKEIFTYGSNISALDQHLGCIQQGELVVIAAETGIGKSEFTWGIAKENAKMNKPVAYMGMEMTPDKYILRLIRARMGFSAAKFKTMKLDPEEQIAFEKEFIKLKEESMNIMFYDRRKNKLADLQAVETFIRSNSFGPDSPKLWVIDGLHNFLETSGQGANTTEAVAKYIYAFEQLCLDCNIAIVVTAQFRKKGFGESINMDLIKDSATVKQKAHTVLLLSRDSGSRDVHKQCLTKIELHKSRDGMAKATVFAKFMPSSGTYYQSGSLIMGVGEEA